MNIKRKTLKMPVRYLMNLVLVGLLFVGLSYVTGNMLSTYQNKVLLTVGSQISQCFFIRHVYNPFLKKPVRYPQRLFRIPCTGLVVFWKCRNVPMALPYK